jgi:preprotein translocase subunit SecG
MSFLANPTPSVCVCVAMVHGIDELSKRFQWFLLFLFFFLSLSLSLKNNQNRMRDSRKCRLKSWWREQNEKKKQLQVKVQ